jgi:hypothetical protein
LGTATETTTQGEVRGTVRGEIANLTHREHAGIALSHFFFVRVHFSHARWARSTVSSMGELELRGDPEPAVIVFWLAGHGSCHSLLRLLFLLELPILGLQVVVGYARLLCLSASPH